MRKTLLKLFTFVLCIIGMQNALLAQEQTPLNQVVNTLKERISLSGYAQLGYTYDDAANPDNTFDIKRIIFMAHGKITKRWTCDFMYDFYNGGMLLEVYTDYQFLPGLTARIGEFKVPYTIENELSPTTVELINCYSQSVNLYQKMVSDTWGIADQSRLLILDNASSRYYHEVRRTPQIARLVKLWS